MVSETKKYKRFSHSPFTFEWNGVFVSVDKDGKVVFTQNNRDEDGEPVEDRITTSASLVYRLASMLSATKKQTWEDTPFQRDNEDEEG